MTTRRQFLIGAAAVAGGVAVGFRLGLHEELLDLVAGDPPETALTPYVLVRGDGITIITPRGEMGQGIHTTLAALVAEELDVTLDAVRVEHGPASDVYANNIFYGEPPYPAAMKDVPKQATGGQTSIRDAFVKMRQAGAAARIMLVAAAAERLGVTAERLTTRDGAVHDDAGRAIPYGELAVAAAAIEPPADPPLRPRSQWKLLGRSQPRVDMPGKCTGTARYGMDVRLPGMLFATVRRNPRLGGRMLSCDASRAEAMRGVERVIPMETGFIVVATNTWYALQAADAVAAEWGPAPYPATTEGHRERVEAALEGEPYYRPRDRGDVEAALGRADVVLEGRYRVPYLAHAPLEPMNATALLADGRLEIWVGNQFPTLAVADGARLAGLPREAVRVHTPYMGGGFGRRFEMDDVHAAVVAARELPGRPVQVTYSREEDFTHDVYRPMASARFRAGVAGGRPVALDLDLSTPSLFASAHHRRSRRTGEPDQGVPETDISITMGAREQPYAIPHYRVTAYRPEELLPVGWWRSVGESQNSFFHESLIDELAHAAGADPLEMRLALLSRHRPSRRVLESVAEMSGWGSPLPPGHARGVAYVLSDGVATAEVVEIRVADDRVELQRVWAAVDVGIALDRRNIEAQVQGAIQYGLSAAIHGEITLTDGAVDQANFDTYPLLRIHHAPSVEVRVHERGHDIRGIGEAAVPAAAPALGNALFAATGERVRELPFGKRFRFG